MNSMSSSQSWSHPTVIWVPFVFSSVILRGVDLMNVASVLNFPSAEVQVRVLACRVASLASAMLFSRFCSTVSIGMDWMGS